MKIIRTVRGDIDPAQLGITAPHEHIWTDQSLCRSGGRSNFPGITEKAYMHDQRLIESELKMFHNAGGRAIAEMTTDGFGRDVKMLKQLSESSQVHVIAVSGFYIEDCLQDYFEEQDIDGLANILVKEITKGADGSDIRTGILKSAASRRVIEANEEKGARAVARAQIRTGVAITTHTSASVRFEIEGGNSGISFLDIFEEEGVDLSRVIIGHTDENADIRQLLALLKRGAYVQFDTFGKSHWLLDETRLSLLRQIVDAGYSNRILLSSDRCRVSETKTHGGPGYAHILENYVPQMLESGFDENLIHQIFVENPAQVLSFEANDRD